MFELRLFFGVRHDELLSRVLKDTTPRGFEPLISTVTGWHVRPLHHGAPHEFVTEYNGNFARCQTCSSAAEGGIILALG